MHVPEVGLLEFTMFLCLAEPSIEPTEATHGVDELGKSVERSSSYERGKWDISLVRPNRPGSAELGGGPTWPLLRLGAARWAPLVIVYVFKSV